MTAYYSEIDPYAADWLRNLINAGEIAPGDVDERSICDVQPDDLRGYAQHHFFAGIGGWSLALRRAGWPDDRAVCTGSCPCQPFSAAAWITPAFIDQAVERARATGKGVGAMINDIRAKIAADRHKKDFAAKQAAARKARPGAVKRATSTISRARAATTLRFIGSLWVAV